MKLVTVSVGLPREVMWHGRRVSTGIFKEPVAGRVKLQRLNLEGDRQADLTVHGGEFKAVYCYPLANYEYWRKKLPDRELPHGSFGENFTIDGPAENEVKLGDRYAVGTAEVQVTQPRLPCFKLGIKFGADDFVKTFLASRRTGFYVRVTREGEVGAGDELRITHQDEKEVAVSEILRLYLAKKFGEEEQAAARKVIEVDAVPESWKVYFREKLAETS